MKCNKVIKILCRCIVGRQVLGSMCKNHTLVATYVEMVNLTWYEIANGKYLHTICITNIIITNKNISCVEKNIHTQCSVQDFATHRHRICL